jgi:hypothetical protein
MTLTLEENEPLGLPRTTISWRLLFRVKNRTKAQRKIEEVRQAFGRGIEVTESKRYWKDESLWECSMSVQGESGSRADIVFDCLVLAARLGNGWYILGLGGDGGLQVFSGVFDAHQSGTPYVAGLEWASFDLNPPSNMPALERHRPRPTATGTE